MFEGELIGEPVLCYKFVPREVDTSGPFAPQIINHVLVEASSIGEAWMILASLGDFGEVVNKDRTSSRVFEMFYLASVEALEDGTAGAVAPDLALPTNPILGVAATPIPEVAPKIEEEFLVFSQKGGLHVKTPHREEADEVFDKISVAESGPVDILRAEATDVVRHKR